MVQKWNTAAYPVPTSSTLVGAHLIDCDEGIETAITHYYGTTDPSTGASWGADEIGTLWYDSTNVIDAGGDDLGLTVKRWEKLTTDPTYGWRTLYTRAYVAVEPNTNKLNLSNQTNVSATDCDLTSDTSARAVAALLQVQVADHTPASGVYAAFRKNGTTTDAQERRVYPQVADLPTCQQVMVELDSGQIFEYSIAAGAGSTFDLRVDVLGYWERG